MGSRLQHGHGDAPGCEGVRGMSTGEPCANHHCVGRFSGCGIEVPRRDGRRRLCGVADETAEGVALAAKARPFAHREARSLKTASDISCCRKGGECGAREAQCRHGGVDGLLPRSGLPGGRKAIQIPGVDPWSAMARQILEHAGRVAPPEVECYSPLREVPPVATRYRVRPAALQRGGDG